MSDAVALCNGVMRPGAHGHLKFYALQVTQWCKMLSRRREQEDSERNCGDNIATKVVEGKKRAVFEVEGVLLHLTEEVGNTVTSIISHKAHHVDVCEQPVHFCRKTPSNGDVLFHVSKEGRGKVPTKHPW